MSVQNRKIYRVHSLLGHDVVAVIEVRDEEASVFGNQLKETRNGKMALGGIDSFWSVTEEKKAVRFADRAKDSPLSVFSKASGSVMTRMRSGSDLDPHMERQSPAGQRNPSTVSFGTASRVKIGFSSADMSYADVIEQLRLGTLSIQCRSQVDFIEVGEDTWVTGGFARRADGRYGLADGTHAGAMRTVKPDGKVDITRLAAGLIVFRSTPRWSSENEIDLRPEAEALKSAEEWLARAEATIVGVGGAKTLSDLLKARIAGTLASDERRDLAAAVRIMVGRPNLLETLFRLLEREAGWREKRDSFERAEEERLRHEAKARVEREEEESNVRLVELKGQIADAELKLAAISHREVLLRSETDRHDVLLGEKIAEAARRLDSGSSEAVRLLREEIAQVRQDIDKIAKTVPADSSDIRVVATGIEVGQPHEVEPQIRLVAGEKERVAIVRDLASATGLTVAEVSTVIARSTSDLPVLLGSNAAKAAIDIVTAIGGPQAAVVFCDPTKITLSDLLSDQIAGLAEAISASSANPDILVPVALCNLTAGPCEFWLPSLLEMRRLGRLPRNLALVASAGNDGMRVSVPRSVLRSLSPIIMGQVPISGSAVGHGGCWLFDETPDPMRVKDAVQILLRSDKAIDGDLLGPLALLLSRAGISGDQDQAAVRDVLVRQQDWHEVLRTGSENEAIKYFQKVEG